MGKIESINNIKPYMDKQWSGEFPVDIIDDEVVLGYDEEKSIWVKVQYRRDSNCFFPYPYKTSLYPNERMNKFKKI